MLPIKLTLSGLYSYQKKQTIHFDQLTEGGLFGIFGRVGSGKSSILEAISFALYGDTERLNQRENRAYNMLNLQSEEALIVFDFENYEKKKFRFRVKWTRKKNNHKETNTPERQAFEWKNEQWIPLESNDATNIIGLSYENFKRTLIIPQGQFKEFLELKDADRSRMMKEIFKLQAFDLSDKVGILYKKSEAQLSFLLGQLSSFENITQEKLVAFETEETGLIAKLKTATTEQTILENTVLQLEKTEALFNDLANKNQAFELLKTEKTAIEQLQSDLKEYELVQSKFQSKIELKKETANSLKRQQDELQKAKNAIDTLSEEKNNLAVKFEKIEFENQKIEHYQTKSADLIRIKNGIEAQNKLNVISLRCKKGDETIAITRKKLDETITEIEGLNTKFTEISTHQIPSNVLIETMQWFEKQKNQELEFEKITQQSKECEQTITETKKAIHDLGYDFLTYENEINQELASEKNNLKKQQLVQNELLVQQELMAHAQNLVEGKACPVCGATSHPQKMTSSDLESSLKNQAAIISKTNQEIGKLENLDKKLHQLAGIISQNDLQKNKVSAEIKRLALEKNQHEQAFIWDRFKGKNYDDFKIIFENQKKLNQEMQELQQQIDKKRKEQTKLQNELNLYVEKIADLKSDMQLLQGNIQAQKEALVLLEFDAFSNKEIAIIEQEIDSISKKINQIKKEYLEIQIALQEKEQMFTQQKSNANAWQHQIEETEIKLKSIISSIDALLKIHLFDAIETVEKILSKAFDVENVKEKIQDFENKWQLLNSQIAVLKVQTEGQTFDTALFENKKIALKEIQSVVSNLKANQISISKAIEEIRQKLIEKAKLTSERNELENRLLNLKTLSNLFKGAGFVEYVSGVYLRNLCAIANQRFHKMTKNSLSLSLNEKNNFEVIDYLNQGYTRSVKTLSGGQSFQAALCLALALAENIQNLNKSDKNFFFIDEGFGTQDPESIEIIYETLQQLHKENRVVGIISHSEALQERITNHIYVENDTETGSQISYF
uniref:SbcC/MukB-like Walker B domain-containing protein n=3 Tax=Flavobacterium sp. TaxID=239 RepID=UPI00404999FB